MKATVDLQEILGWSFYSNDLDGEITVRSWFKSLLTALWVEQEGFSGKRPFGNSGWDGDLIKLLVERGVVSGSIDADGYLDDYDWDEVEPLGVRLIEAL